MESEGRWSVRQGSRLGALGIGLLVLLFVVLAPASAGARVLRVGSFHGIPGPFKSIQEAVDAAKRGDWVLVGPGDYHERGDRIHNPHGDVPPSGVLIRQNRLHLRGMSRNRVIVDGTKPSARKPCSKNKAKQDFGVSLERRASWAATASSSTRPTASRSTTSPPATSSRRSGNIGNEIWWNGGDGIGQDRPSAPSRARYLNATSTFYNGDRHRRGLRDLLQQLERPRALGPRPTPATSTTPTTTSAPASRSATR